MNAFDDLNVGDSVRIEIDKETRIKNAKLHSAGHMIDLAVQRLSIDYFYFRILMVNCKGISFRR